MASFRESMNFIIWIQSGQPESQIQFDKIDGRKFILRTHGIATNVATKKNNRHTCWSNLYCANILWKHHIEYTCKKLSKCVGILCKARKLLAKPSLFNLCYSFAYPYLIYCNHMRGRNYPTSLEKLCLVQKKVIRIVTCSPYRAHTETLCIANKILNVADLNDYLIKIFMYNYMDGNVPNAFHDFFHINRNILDYELRNADYIQVPYGKLYIRRFSIIIAGANLWNSLPVYVKKR